MLTIYNYRQVTRWIEKGGADLLQKLASQLQFDIIGKEVLSVAEFGSTKTEVRHLDRVQLTIIGERNQHIPIDVLVVPQIGDPIQTHSAEVKQLPHLRN